MSGEQLTAKELNKDNLENNFVRKKTSKVNINDLMSKVRYQKDKEKKENFIFLGLVVGVLAVTGVIASL
tara:strand:- start:329 stop:535 length:207 start_codon:yes stop_codon:yes gene_type:complete